VEPVGVLALQGDFREHVAALQANGLAAREVRERAGLVGLAGLVLPGGESTTMLRLLEVEDLFAPLRATVAGGLPVLATCAGLILLAAEVRNPVQRSLALLDVAVDRNGYGRQIASGTFPLGGAAPPGSTGVFIRAPRIVRVGEAVEVLAHRDGDPVLVRQRNVLAACFHPELEPGHFVTRLFVAAVRAGKTLPHASR
jgi:5'-phosphate synthase pdxT subunit